MKKANWEIKRYEGEVFPTYRNHEIGYQVYHLTSVLNPEARQAHEKTEGGNWFFYPMSDAGVMVFSKGYHSSEEAARAAESWAEEEEK